MVKILIIQWNLSQFQAHNYIGAKFKHTNITLNQITIKHLLCKQCKNHLMFESDYNKKACCWPSYLIESPKK